MFEKNINYQMAATYFEMTFTKFLNPKETTAIYFDTITHMSSTIGQINLLEQITRSAHHSGKITFERVRSEKKIDELQYWFAGSAHLEKPLQRKDVTVRLMTRHEHQEIEKWTIQKAWPIEWAMTAIFDPQQLSAALHGETISFLHEGIFPYHFAPMIERPFFSLHICEFVVFFPSYACRMTQKKTFSLSHHTLIGQSVSLTSFEGGHRHECLLNLQLDADLLSGKDPQASFENTPIHQCIEGLKALEKFQIRNTGSEPICLKMASEHFFAYPKSWDLTYLKFSSIGKPISIQVELCLVGSFWNEKIDKENALSLYPPQKTPPLVSPAAEKNQNTASKNPQRLPPEVVQDKKEIEAHLKKSISKKINDYWNKKQPLLENLVNTSAILKNVTAAANNIEDYRKKLLEKKEEVTEALGPIPSHLPPLSPSDPVTDNKGSSLKTASDSPSEKRHVFSSPSAEKKSTASASSEPISSTSTKEQKPSISGASSKSVSGEEVIFSSSVETKIEGSIGRVSSADFTSISSRSAKGQPLSMSEKSEDSISGEEVAFSSAETSIEGSTGRVSSADFTSISSRSAKGQPPSMSEKSEDSISAEEVAFFSAETSIEGSTGRVSSVDAEPIPCASGKKDKAFFSGTNSESPSGGAVSSSSPAANIIEGSESGGALSTGITSFSFESKGEQQPSVLEISPVRTQASGFFSSLSLGKEAPGENRSSFSADSMPSVSSKDNPAFFSETAFESGSGTKLSSYVISGSKIKAPSSFEQLSKHNKDAFTSQKINPPFVQQEPMCLSAYDLEHQPIPSKKPSPSFVVETSENSLFSPAMTPIIEDLDPMALTAVGSFVPLVSASFQDKGDNMTEAVLSDITETLHFSCTESTAFFCDADMMEQEAVLVQDVPVTLFVDPVEESESWIEKLKKVISTTEKQTQKCVQNELWETEGE